MQHMALCVLVLKGTISEVELHQIRARMARGRLNKALRGELEISLPVGLERDPLSGEIRLAVDQSVRHRVDALVSESFLSVLNEGTLERSLTFDELLQNEVAEQERGWKEKVERLEYQADLARRRYEMVDPANRLVAQTLETDWEERLRMVEATRKEYEVRSRSRRPLHSTLAQMQEVIEHLREYWENGFLRQEDKKELVRCLIEQVF